MDETKTSSVSSSPGSSSRNASPRRRRWPIIVVGVVLALFILGGASVAGAMVLEQNDSFCASCHTVPESTYVQRSMASISNPAATIPDLSTMHYHMTQQKTQAFTCIECHSGDGSFGQRIETLTLGGRDILIFVSGKGDPALEKTTFYKPALSNDACISCHTDTLLTMKGIQSHYHNWLPQTAALVASGKQLITSSTGRGEREGRTRTVNTSITCTSCHLAHKTVENGQQTMFVDRTIAQQACDTCHRDAGQRPANFDRLNREGE